MIEEMSKAQALRRLQALEITTPVDNTMTTSSPKPKATGGVQITFSRSHWTHINLALTGASLRAEEEEDSTYSAYLDAICERIEVMNKNESLEHAPFTTAEIFCGLAQVAEGNEISLPLAAVLERRGLVCKDVSDPTEPRYILTAKSERLADGRTPLDALDDVMRNNGDAWVTIRLDDPHLYCVGVDDGGGLEAGASAPTLVMALDAISYCNSGEHVYADEHGHALCLECGGGGCDECSRTGLDENPPRRWPKGGLSG